MKISSKILLLMFIIMVAGLLFSNMLLKWQYDRIDKSDIYWTYDKVLEKPFKYLDITGGNETSIYYEQSAKPSVRLLREWVKYHGGSIKADVRNDTLYLTFDVKPANPYEKIWLQHTVPVRIFSRQLLSVTGKNTFFEMQKLRQKSILVNISGKSKFEVETMDPEMESINIIQHDSSAVVFEMSPDYRKSSSENMPKGKVELHDLTGVTVVYSPKQADFSGSLSFNSVTANINDHSILDVGHAQIKNINVHVSDSSAIVLSGDALKKLIK